MLVKESEAWQASFDNADRFLKLEAYSHGDCRIILEGEPLSEKPSGVLIGEQGLALPEKLEELNNALIKKGWHDLSQWWRRQVARAYMFHRRDVIARAGRRGGKSSTICRICVYECLYGDHIVQPGDTGVFAIISAERGQAKDRITMIGRICETLGFDAKVLKEVVIFLGQDREARVYTASINGVVGFTGIGGVCDEEATWLDEDTGTNPAEEVIKTLRPCMATNPSAKLWHISSPRSTLDVHARMFSQGTGPYQLVFESGPTWIANPYIGVERDKLDTTTLEEAQEISKEYTRSLEPDEQTWLREYGAVPTPSDEQSFFPADALERALEPKDFILTEDTRTVAGADFAFRSDASGLVPLKVGLIYQAMADVEWKALERTLSPDEVIGDALERCATLGVSSICCDLHYIDTVADKIEDTDIELVEFPQAQDKIERAFVKARVLFTQGKVDISKCSPKLISQLRHTRTKATQNGFSIIHPRGKGSHGDLARALIAAIYAADKPEGVKVVPKGRRFENGREGAKPEWKEYADED